MGRETLPSVPEGEDYDRALYQGPPNSIMTIMRRLVARAEESAARRVKSGAVASDLGSPISQRPSRPALASVAAL